MNDIINKLLLTGNKFTPEMHLRQPRFTYSACGPLTKKKERIQKFRETGDTKYIFRNELDKACFQHDMAYGDFKDLAKRTAADKVLRDETFNIDKDIKCDGCQRGSMVYKFFDKKTAGSGIKNEIKENQQLANELHNLVIRKFNKRKVYSAYKDYIWDADLADMQLICKFNKEFRFSLCVIDIVSKFAWVVPLKYKKGASIVDAFQKFLKQSNKKPSKI